jgi:hypothetical protein
VSKKCYGTERSKKEMIKGGGRKIKVGLLLFFIARAAIACLENVGLKNKTLSPKG